MYFRLLFVALVALGLAGTASAQNTAQPVITGYLTMSGCPSTALTPCFVQYGVGGGGGGGSVTQGTTPWVDDITQWANVALGAPSNYGTSPGAVAVPGVNAFVTNVPAVTLNAGSAIVGQFRIDQTTPGTTNLVALAANQSVNEAQINGVTPLMGNGVSGTGSQRVNIASDNTAFSVNAATSPGTRTIVTLDVKTVTTGGTAVTALTSGHKSAGGWIQNPSSATINLCINEISTATGTTSSGDTTCIIPGQTYNLVPSSGAVSVITSDSSHPFSGYGFQ